MSARRAERRAAGAAPIGQRGVALITVLLVIAIVTAVVSRMSLANELWLRQVRNGADALQLEQATLAAERWVALILERDDPAYDGVTDPWAQPVSSLPIGRGTIHGRVEDLQGRYNVNNLVDERGLRNDLEYVRFRRLLELLQLDPDIADAVVDWIDRDAISSGAGGAERDWYAQFAPGVVPPDRPCADPAELGVIRGMHAQAWRRLQAQVTALPLITEVNVNAASAEVLAAVITQWGEPAIALGEARRWLSQSRGRPATGLETFAAQALGGPDRLVPPGLSVASRFFRASIELRFGQVAQRTAAVYYRNGDRAIVIDHRREFR